MALITIKTIYETEFGEQEAIIKNLEEKAKKYKAYRDSYIGSIAKRREWWRISCTNITYNDAMKKLRAGEDLELAFKPHCKQETIDTIIKFINSARKAGMNT